MNLLWFLRLLPRLHHRRHHHHLLLRTRVLVLTRAVLRRHREDPVVVIQEEADVGHVVHQVEVEAEEGDIAVILLRRHRRLAVRRLARAIYRDLGTERERRVERRDQDHLPRLFRKRKMTTGIVVDLPVDLDHHPGEEERRVVVLVRADVKAEAMNDHHSHLQRSFLRKKNKIPRLFRKRKITTVIVVDLPVDLDHHPGEEERRVVVLLVRADVEVEAMNDHHSRLQRSFLKRKRNRIVMIENDLPVDHRPGADRHRLLVGAEERGVVVVPGRTTADAEAEATADLPVGRHPLVVVV